MAFQAKAAIRAPQVNFLNRAVATRAFYLLSFPLTIQNKYEKSYERKNQYQPEEPAVIKVTAMPGEAPVAIHGNSLCETEFIIFSVLIRVSL